MNILVIRLSALGDVALTVPAIKSVLKSNNDIRIFMLSKSFHSALFDDDRITFIKADIYNKHKGIKGLNRLVKEILSSYKINIVVDLHNVIRTKIIRRLFTFRSVKSLYLKKDRRQIHNIINKDEPLVELRHITSRYLDVFDKIIPETKLINSKYISYNYNNLLNNLDFNKKTIGIAPFSAHKSKQWGLDKISLLINQVPDCNFILFGGGESEINKLSILDDKYSHCTSIAGKFSLVDELSIMDKLDVMISMDSANMHLATLVGIPVISIWGSTHSYLGYSPLNNKNNIIEIPVSDLKCRPCSIYGKLSDNKLKECGHLCMENISVENVIRKLKPYLNLL